MIDILHDLGRKLLRCQSVQGRSQVLEGSRSRLLLLYFILIQKARLFCFVLRILIIKWLFLRFAKLPRNYIRLVPLHPMKRTSATSRPLIRALHRRTSVFRIDQSLDVPLPLRMSRSVLLRRDCILTLGVRNGLGVIALIE